MTHTILNGTKAEIEKDLAAIDAQVAELKMQRACLQKSFDVEVNANKRMEADITRLKEQLKAWNDAADQSRHPDAFYDGYGEAQMRAMQAMLTSAEKHADDLAAQLAECAGILCSCDTERRFRDMHGNLWISQTLDWCKGARAIGEKSNALLEAHDDLANQ